jgi:hypothetical protein
MHLSEDQKLQVLLVELQERYNASHKIRERSTKFALWISGMAIGLAWLLVSQKELVLTQCIALTFLIITLFTGTVIFIMGLRRGFRKNREAMIRSERVLAMHEPCAYLADAALLPPEYNNIKTKWSDHFYTLCVWLILVVVSLLMLTWTCPEPTHDCSPDTKIEQLKGGKNNG